MYSCNHNYPTTIQNLRRSREFQYYYSISFVKLLFKIMQRQNLSVYEYILGVNLENLTNYKLNTCEKKGNDTLI